MFISFLLSTQVVQTEYRASGKAFSKETFVRVSVLAVSNLTVITPLFRSLFNSVAFDVSRVPCRTKIHTLEREFAV